MKSIKVKIKYLNSNKEMSIPNYASLGAAGVDICANLEEKIELMPNQIVKIPTGIALELPGVEVVALVCARSGLASKGVSLANGVGVIDSDYRGEVQVLLINHGSEPYFINDGDRIAQILFLPVLKAEFEITEELVVTERGTGGFGSTGVN